LSTTPKPNRTTSDRHTCEELSRGSMWQRYPCGNTARFRETKCGKEQWFCAMHAPSERQRRRDERHEAKVKLLRPQWEAEAKQHRIEKAATDLLAALRPFAEQKCYGAEAGYAPHVCLNTPTCPTCAARAAIAKAEGREYHAHCKTA
jgi:hypothetical protein